MTHRIIKRALENHADKTPLRIGVNCYLLTDKIGGMYQYFFNLFNELERNYGEHKYVFFYFEHNRKWLAKLKQSRWKRDGQLLRDQLEVESHLDKIDLYFCPFSFMVPRPLPIPTVVFLHDIQEFFFPEFFSKEELFGRDYHFKGSTRMADMVVTNSGFTRKTILDAHGVSPDKVVVSHLNAEPIFFHARRLGIQPRAMLPKKDFILYPANRWKHKNHLRLLKALKWLKQERSITIEAVFTGHDPDGGPTMKEMAAACGIEDQVFCPGYVTVRELAWLYHAAKLTVYPSLFEGFGMPLIEAMAAGCPVAASDIDPLTEVGGCAAVYFKPTSVSNMAETIENIWLDPLLRRRMAEKGKHRAKKFSAANMARVHARAFETACERFSAARFFWHWMIYRHWHKFMIYRKHNLLRLWRP